MKMGALQTATIPMYVLDPPEPGTTSNAVDLGRWFEYIQLVIPTLDSATLTIQGAPTLGGTYANIEVENPLAAGHFTLATSAGVGGITVTGKLGGWRYVKLVANNAQTTAARNILVRGANE